MGAAMAWRAPSFSISSVVSREASVSWVGWAARCRRVPWQSICMPVSSRVREVGRSATAAAGAAGDAAGSVEAGAAAGAAASGPLQAASIRASTGATGDRRMRCSLGESHDRPKAVAQGSDRFVLTLDQLPARLLGKGVDLLVAGIGGAHLHLYLAVGQAGDLHLAALALQRGRVRHHRPFDLGKRHLLLHLAWLRLGVAIDVAVQQRIGSGRFLQCDLVTEMLEEVVEDRMGAAGRRVCRGRGNRRGRRRGGGRAARSRCGGVSDGSLGRRLAARQRKPQGKRKQGNGAELVQGILLIPGGRARFRRGREARIAMPLSIQFQHPLSGISRHAELRLISHLD
ncbi:hypothetical protein BN126310291 [Stenotrophomonas thermophila]|nr:hypothetical protein BN126310291 [Stenotrophomonas maltophilia]